MQVNVLAVKNRTTKRTKENITDRTVAWWEGKGFNVHVEYNDGQLPAYGRNRILQKFYASNEPWLCMIDDDITLDETRGDYAEFLSDPVSVLSKTPEHISSVHALNNIHIRVDYTYKDPIYKTHWRFERDFNMSKIVFHKRTGNEWYQRTDIPALEDYDWAFQQLKDGYVCSRLNNIVLKEMGTTSLFTDNNERKEAYEHSKQVLIETYPELYISPRGHFMKKNLVNKYLKHKDIHIDRLK